jgi:hypothetical protein
LPSGAEGEGGDHIVTTAAENEEEEKGSGKRPQREGGTRKRAEEEESGRGTQSRWWFLFVGRKRKPLGDFEAAREGQVQSLQAKRVLPLSLTHHVTVDDVIDDCVLEARGKGQATWWWWWCWLRGRAARLCAGSGEDGMDER